MRICTITCQNTDNHGARLQAYALAKHLRDQDNEVEIIDYRPPYMDPAYRVFYWPGCGFKEWGRFFYYLPNRILMRRRHASFVSFANRYLPLTKRVYHSISDLRSYPPEADLYLAGSDQIWNTYFPNGTDPAYYLDFGDTSIRRESYAASFGANSLRPGSEEFVKVNLTRFQSISVREDSGLEILEKMGYHGELKDDPVFLLSCQQWDMIADAAGKGDNYVLVYDFFSDKKIKIKAKSLAKEKRLRIYAICPRWQLYADKNFVTSGPETFVSLVKNASYVVTNSFHAIAFSIIFHRPFEFVERPDGLNDRMRDFLGRHKSS